MGVGKFVGKKKSFQKKKCKIHETKIPVYIQVLFPFPAVIKANSINGHLKAIYAKNKRNSVQYVNLKPAKEKLEIYFFLKMSTFVTETSFQFKE